MEETHDTIGSNDEYNNTTRTAEQTDATTTNLSGISHSEQLNKSDFNSYGSNKKEDYPIKAEQQLQEILKSQENITKIMACTMSTSAQCLQPQIRSIQPTTSKQALEKFNEYEQKVNEKNLLSGLNLTPIEEVFDESPDSQTDSPNINDATPTSSIRSIGSLVCRICHNSENPEALVSPCLCKGSLTYVHVHCLERWISTSRSTICELCQFQYNTEQTLRYSCLQSLRMWYSRSMSRRALQEDCQMFSLLTLIAFAIVGTLLVGIQFYFLQGHTTSLTRIWTKGWLVFFLFTTLSVYVINVYMIVKTQLTPWYRWWQSARDIKLILENRNPFQLGHVSRKLQQEEAKAQNSLPLPQLLPPLSSSPTQL